MPSTSIYFYILLNGKLTRWALYIETQCVVDVLYVNNAIQACAYIHCTLTF